MAVAEWDDLIEIDCAGGAAIVHLHRFSRLGSARRERLQDYLCRLAEEAEGRRLWLDFQRVADVDDEVLSFLLRLQRRLSALGGHLLVANPQPLVQETLALKRVDHILDLRAGLPIEPLARATPHEEGFLSSIIEEPDDDVVRLIYADWLEDRDDPRGEFIRAQCLLASLPADDSRCGELQRRAQELLEQHETNWTAPVCWRVTHCEFRRGFIEQVTLTGFAFVENAAALARLAPIRDLQLLPGWPLHPDLLAALLVWPLLARLQRLKMAFNNLGDASVQALADCPATANLRALDLSGNGLRAAGAAALAGSRHLINLETLDLRGNGRIGEEGRHALQARFGGGELLL